MRWTSTNPSWMNPSSSPENPTVRKNLLNSLRTMTGVLTDVKNASNWEMKLMKMWTLMKMSSQANTKENAATQHVWDLGKLMLCQWNDSFFFTVLARQHYLDIAETCYFSSFLTVCYNKFSLNHFTYRLFSKFIL